MRPLLSLVAACVLTASASAHSPFLLPNAFVVEERDHVTVLASFTESFFAPDVVMKSDDYNVVGPGGEERALVPAYFKDLAVLEVTLEAEGSYRISTGARVGRTAKAYEKDGNWEFLEPGAAPPGGVTAVDMISLTQADVFVTRGKPSPVAPRNRGLELVPEGEAAVGAAARFRLLFDGNPLSGQAVQLHRDGEAYAGTAPVEVKSGPDGRIAFTAGQAGIYLVMSRYRTGPEREGGPHRSFTAALTVEIVP